MFCMFRMAIGRLQQAEARDLLGPAEEGQRDGVAAAQMAGARRRGHVAEGLGEGGPRVVGRDLQLLDGHGQVGAAAAGRPAGRSLRPGARRCPRRWAVVDRQLLQGRGVAEAEVEAARRPRGGRRPALGELHGAGDGAAEAHRVQPELVAAVIGPGDGGQVVDVADRAHQDDGLVFRALAPFLGRPVGRVDAGVPLAADRAEIAAAPPSPGWSWRCVSPEIRSSVLVAVGAVLEVRWGSMSMTLISSTSPAVPSSRMQALGHRRLVHEIEGLVVAGLVSFLVVRSGSFPGPGRGWP